MHGLEPSTPSHSTPFTRILALDLGKFNSVLCRYDPATHGHSFFSVQTTPQTIHDLLVAHQTDHAASTLLVTGLKAEIKDLTPVAPAANRPKAWVCFMPVAGGIALLGAGAHATVSGAVQLARWLGWSERVIGLTIISAATGLPEVVASLVSSARGRSDVAIGNVIGSNLFNILVVLGLSGLATPLPVQRELVTSDCVWMMGVTILLVPLMYIGRRLSRGKGIVLLAVYAVYVMRLLSSAV